MRERTRLDRRIFGYDALLSGLEENAELIELAEAYAAVAAGACASAADRWRGWMRDATPASWMSNRMIYDRECDSREHVLLLQTLFSQQYVSDQHLFQR